MTSERHAGPEGEPGARPTTRAGDLPPEIRVRTLLTGVAIRALAQSARRGGVEAASVDLFGDRDHRRALPLLSLRDTDAGDYSARKLVRLCRRVEADEVVYGADLENHPGLVARLAERRRLLGNPPGVLRRVRDPFHLRASLRERGLPAPAVRRHDDLPSPDAGPSGWLRKPLRGGGGRGVRAWRPGEPLTGREYLQRRIPGTPVSVLFLSDGRAGRLLAVTEMLVGRPALGAKAFTYCGSLLRLPDGAPPGPPGLPGEAFPWREARTLAGQLADEFELVGLNGLDAVLADGRLWPVEVNPRWTASMELLEPGPAGLDPAAGPTLFEMHRRACDGELPAAAGPDGTGIARRWASLRGPGRPEPDDGGRRERVVGKAVLRAPHAVRTPDLETLEDLEGPVLADVPGPGEEVPAGGPVCSILAAARDRAACLDRLEASAARIREALVPREG